MCVKISDFSFNIYIGRRENKKLLFGGKEGEKKSGERENNRSCHLLSSFFSYTFLSLFCHRLKQISEKITIIFYHIINFTFEYEKKFFYNVFKYLLRRKQK